MKHLRNALLSLLVIVFFTMTLSSCMVIGSIVRYHMNKKEDRPPPYSEEGLGTLGEVNEND